jgi:hypothetical protein
MRKREKRKEKKQNKKMKTYRRPRRILIVFISLLLLAFLALFAGTQLLLFLLCQQLFEQLHTGYSAVRLRRAILQRTLKRAVCGRRSAPVSAGEQSGVDLSKQSDE